LLKFFESSTPKPWRIDLSASGILSAETTNGPMEGPLPASSTPMCRAIMPTPTEPIPSKLLLSDSKKGKYDLITPHSNNMGPIWPFKGKKSSKSKVSRANYMRDVVEYKEKKPERKKKKKRITKPILRTHSS
jgi:hypothetical protein